MHRLANTAGCNQVNPTKIEVLVIVRIANFHHFSFCQVYFLPLQLTTRLLDLLESENLAKGCVTEAFTFSSVWLHVICDFSFLESELK